MTRDNVKTDIPLNIITTVLLIIFGMHFTLFGIGNDNTLSRLDGVIFLILFSAYMYWSFKSGKAEETKDSAEPESGKIWVAILMVLGGLAALIFGGDKFVDSATNIARMLNISDKFIAVTILAGGTSMPELVTCVVAAAKKKGQLALGNILGSNIGNILMILGVSAAAYKPQPGSPSGLSFSGMTFVDLGILLLGALLIWVSAFTRKGRKLDRVEGSILLACFAGYMTWLLINL
jgi:cation:H+ antiporter